MLKCKCDVEPEEVLKVLGKYGREFVSVGVVHDDLMDLHRIPGPAVHDDCIYGTASSTNFVKKALEELGKAGDVDVVRIRMNQCDERNIYKKKPKYITAYRCRSQGTKRLKALSV